MSRSRKKNPIFGHTGNKSEKKDKRLANRALRRRFKEAIEADEEIMPTIDDVSDIWGFSKDGKYWMDDPTWKDMKK